ncbi:MAG: DUF971 family protein [Candidatus Thalassarchaeaceae archaeon]|jgi:DUF971 family protein
MDMEDHNLLTTIERDEESCILRFKDGKSFQVDYLEIRFRCRCAKCKPRQENEQRIVEFHEEISRLRIEKPSVDPVGHYGIQLTWPSGCSSGIHSFSHLRSIAEESGNEI